MDELTPTARQAPRPIISPEQEQPKYWVPRLQEWVSLNELEYLKIAEKVRKEE